MVRLTGHEAIEWARAHGAALSKYADPIEGPRVGLTPDEAAEIAAEDPSLIYVDEPVRPARTSSVPAARTALREALAAWSSARMATLDADIPRLDAEHAKRVGLPTLAALLEAEASLTSNAPVTQGELAAVLRGIRQVFVGEATVRIRRLLGDGLHPGIPGIGVLPAQGSILETRYGSGGRGRPPKRPGYPAGTRRRSA